MIGIATRRLRSGFGKQGLAHLAVRFGLLAVAVLVAVTAGELVIRRFPHFWPPQKQLADFGLHSPFAAVVPDPDVGFLPPPNVHKMVHTSDYAHLYQTDSRGFSNTDPWPVNSTVVFLGDSLVFGYGVGLSGSFAHLVGQMLPASEQNLALAGAGPERQYAVFQKFGAALHPRLVVAGLFLASDFDNDLHFSAWIRQGRPPDYNHFRLELARSQTDTRTAGLEHTLEKSWIYADGRGELLSWLEGPQYLSDRHRFADGSEILLSRGTMQFAMTPASPTDPRVDAAASLFDWAKYRGTKGAVKLHLVLDHDGYLPFSRWRGVYASSLGRS
jgi:hypothetical protein